MRDDFAMLIISHGRADDVATVPALEAAGYTGKWYIIVDDEDDQYEKYIENYGESHIIQFCKVDAMRNTRDAMDNFEVHGVPVYARNMLHSIAKDLGLTYFMEIEDDMVDFRYRYEDGDALRSVKLTKLDAIVDVFLEFLDVSGAITVAFSEAGDLLGGKERIFWKSQLNRKAMMCYFMRTDRPFQFTGTFNDDVNMYVQLGKVGNLIFTVAPIMVIPKLTQQNSGGITDAYNKYGTYVKSFYSVMLCPDCVYVKEMPTRYWRIHHAISWKNAIPKIVSSRFRKE